MRDIRQSMTLTEIIAYYEALLDDTVEFQNIEPFPSETLARQIHKLEYLMIEKGIKWGNIQRISPDGE